MYLTLNMFTIPLAVPRPDKEKVREQNDDAATVTGNESEKVKIKSLLLLF